MPGVLKNAIDCASRPPDQPFNGKPTAIFGASPGMIGTAVAQYDLRPCLSVLNALVMNTPSVMIGQASEKFDGQADPERRSGSTTTRHATRLTNCGGARAVQARPALEIELPGQAHGLHALGADGAAT
jgi:NAD(P)H-dependent FMN reductase